MKRYKMSLNKDQVNDELFTWFLVFSDIINCFAVLQIEHFMEINRNDWRLSTFISRLILGYVSEAQKTINHFLLCPEYSSFFSDLLTENRDSYTNQKENWETSVNSPIKEAEHKKETKGYKLSNEIRNLVFHFAERNCDLQSYRDRFLMMCEDDAKEDASLEYTAGEDDLIASCDLVFVNQLWDYAIRKKHKETESCDPEGKTNEDEKAVNSLMKMFGLTYDFALTIWSDIELYLLKKEVITEED